LSHDPYISALHTSFLMKLATKIPLEVAQMLSTPYEKQKYVEIVDKRKTSGVKSTLIPYAKTHVNHPITVWVADSKKNWEWALVYGKTLNYLREKQTGNTSILEYAFNWLGSNPPRFSSEKLTQFPTAMDKYPECKGSDPVASYKRYFVQVKHNIASNEEEIASLNMLRILWGISKDEYPDLERR